MSVGVSKANGWVTSVVPFRYHPKIPRWVWVWVAARLPTWQLPESHRYDSWFFLDDGTTVWIRWAVDNCSVQTLRMVQELWGQLTHQLQDDTVVNDKTLNKESMLPPRIFHYQSHTHEQDFSSLSAPLSRPCRALVCSMWAWSYGCKSQWFNGSTVQMRARAQTRQKTRGKQWIARDRRRQD